MSTSPALVPEEPDPLRDPHRIAAARRLIVEVPGPAAFDRLSGLAARLLDIGHAKVTLFTDQDTVVGGYGLPPGVIGGPALLTGALSAIVVRQGAPLSLPDAAGRPAGGRPAGGDVRPGARLPGLAARRGVRSRRRRAHRLRPRAAGSGPHDESELLRQLAASVVAELELSAARSAVGTSVTRLNVALEASSIGTWERDLRTGAHRPGTSAAPRCSGSTAPSSSSWAPWRLQFVHRDDIAPLQEAMARAMEEHGQFTAEFRAIRADGSVRWMVSRGRMVTDSRGEPVRLLGTILDVTDARRQAAQRLSAMQRSTAIAEVAAELANAARMEDLPEIVQRGAQVLDATSSALAIFEPGNGPLRLHMTNRLTDEIQTHVEYPVAGVEIELDDTQPTQYAAMHGRRVLLADREEAIARFPAVREGMDILNIHAMAALPLRVEGRILGAFVPLWSTPHPFASDDVEVLEALAAQIALSVSRLQADAERAAAVTAMQEANQRLQVLAEAGRILSGSAGHRPAGQRAGRTRRPRPRRLVLARRHRRAGPAPRPRLRPPRPVPAARRSRTTCDRWSA